LLVHSKEGILFLIQVDHLSGEWIGQAIDVFYKAGASNVQVVSAITKKNRPSYMVYIDCKAEYSEAIEALIPMELNTGGWHRIETEHRFLHNQIIHNKLIIQSENDYLEFIVEGKRFESGSMRPEHDNVIALKDEIAERFAIHKSYGEVYQMAMTTLQSNQDSIRIML